jgi:hypothetical protein
MPHNEPFRANRVEGFAKTPAVRSLAGNPRVRPPEIPGPNHPLLLQHRFGRRLRDPRHPRRDVVVQVLEPVCFCTRKVSVFRNVYEHSVWVIGPNSVPGFGKGNTYTSRSPCRFPRARTRCPRPEARWGCWPSSWPSRRPEETSRVAPRRLNTSSGSRRPGLREAGPRSLTTNKRKWLTSCVSRVLDDGLVNSHRNRSEQSG